MIDQETANSSEKSAEVCVTTREAAQVIGCHIQTLRRMAAAGRVPAIRVGRDFRFQLNKVLTALAA